MDSPIVITRLIRAIHMDYPDKPGNDSIFLSGREEDSTALL